VTEQGLSKTERKRLVEATADNLGVSIKAARRIVDGMLVGGDYDELIAREVDKPARPR
jgi:hypothetical protein